MSVLKPAAFFFANRFFPIVILGWVLKGEIMAIHRETNALLTKIVLSPEIG